MVLKKSNSPFNSGNTQRLCNRGAFKRESYYDYYRDAACNSQQNVVTLIVYGLPHKLDKDARTDDFQTALDRIYDYLDFYGPPITEFLNPKHYIQLYTYSQDVSLRFCSEQKQFWSLSEAVERLQNDDEFSRSVKELPGLPEIRIVKEKYLAHTAKRENNKGRLFNRKGIKKRAKLFKTKREKRKSELELSETGGRGVQRTHLLKQKDNLDEHNYYDEDGFELNKRITFHLLEKDHVDTRILQGPNNDCSRSSIPRKSMSKTKGCVNGKGSYEAKGYDKRDIDLGHLEYINIEHYSGEYLSIENDDDYFYESNYSNNDYEDTLKRDSGFIIRPTITYRNKKRDKKKSKCELGKDEKNGETETAYTISNINSASSKQTIKHCKGSFEVIDPPYRKDQLKEQQHSDANAGESTSTNEEQQQQPVYNTDLHLENGSAPYIKQHTFHTRDEYTSVNLAIDNKYYVGEDTTIYYLNTAISSSVEHKVSVANSFPPSFSVALETDDVRYHGHTTWKLIGTAQSTMPEVDTLSWQVTIKCSNDDENLYGARKDFFSRVNKHTNTALSLGDLVRIATIAVTRNAKTDSLQRQTEKRINCKDFKLKENSSKLQYNNYQNVGIYTLKEALNQLQEQSDSNENYLPNKELLTTGNIGSFCSMKDIPKTSLDCDVCFSSCNKYGAVEGGALCLLPCKHIFCFSCWLSHIYHHVRNGRGNIPCMHSDCKQKLNSIWMDVMIPNTALNKLHFQENERKIEKSPLCKWCPKLKCNKVAMTKVTNDNTETFGFPVLCDCKFVWCFSCLETPHHPASCNQVNVYRQLKDKLEHDIPMDIDFKVELKPCPMCRYPIEKNEGCPHMTCVMCECEFCWKCLGNPMKHNVYRCRVDEDSNFRSYHLNTTVASTFPLKFFDKAIDVSKRSTELKKQNLYRRFGDRVAIATKRPKALFLLSAVGKVKEKENNSGVRVARQCVDFLFGTYAYLEYFYMLLSFADLNNANESSKYKNRTVAYLRYHSGNLMSVMSRLESILVESNGRQIAKWEANCKMLLETGGDILGKMVAMVPQAQALSMAVNTNGYEELNPSDYYKYT